MKLRQLQVLQIKSYKKRTITIEGGHQLNRMRTWIHKRNRRMSDITEAEQIHEPVLDFCENSREKNRE